MAKSVPPALVRTLMSKGCMGEFAAGAAAFNPDESVALTRWFARLLGERRAEAGDLLVETLAAIVAASSVRHRGPQAIACAKGCGFCCHQKVSVNAVELFSVVRHLRRTKDLGRHRARLAARPERSYRPGAVFDATKPCSFLVDNACSIHPFRPSPCRIIVSFDARACERRLHAGDGLIPWPQAQGPIRHWLNTALWAALAATGLETRTYDLEAGAELLLADPAIEARWYAGDDGLAAAADPPLPAALQPEIDRLRALARL
jgi:hypothetical protein